MLLGWKRHRLVCHPQVRLEERETGPDAVSSVSHRFQRVWILWSLLALQMDVYNTKEYCLLDHFEPSCSEPGFILIRFAYYGRMHIGRCLSRDYYLGCSRDVTAHLDLQCSGKKYCRVAIPEENLLKLVPCPEDLVAYLEVDYTCINVESGTSQQCLKDRYVLATKLSGYLTTHVIFATEIGSEFCPWRILASPGQRINLTLVNLNTVSSANISASGWESITRTGSRQNCGADSIATVREVLEDSTVLEKIICLTTTRETSVYVSQGSSLTVALSSAFRRELNGSAKYLLKYEVFGCGEPDMPSGAHVSRSGDKAFVGCSGIRRSWTLLCRDNEWIGQVGECHPNQGDSLTKTASVSMEDSSLSLFSSGMHSVGMWTALAIGVTVGVAVGICLLVALYSLQHRCLKKRESLLRLRIESRKQTGGYSSVKRRACAGRFFRLPRPGNIVEDELRMRYMQSQYLCPHRTKKRTMDTSLYMDCPQMTNANNVEPCKKEQSLLCDTKSCLLERQQSPNDSDEITHNFLLTNQHEQAHSGSGLCSQSESFVRSASIVSSKSTGSMTFTAANKIEVF